MHSDVTTDIERWARERSFSELGGDEASAAIAILGSRDAYERLHAVLGATLTSLARDVHAAQPDPAISRRLHVALEARTASAAVTATLPTAAHVPSMRVASLRTGAHAAHLGRRIRLYQAALATALAAMLVALLGPGASRDTIVQRQIVPVPVFDTLIVTREIPAPRTEADATTVAAPYRMRPRSQAQKDSA